MSHMDYFYDAVKVGMKGNPSFFLINRSIMKKNAFAFTQFVFFPLLFCLNIEIVTSQ